MLKLRRGVVTGIDPLTVEVAGEPRRAWADEVLVGPCEVGDEVVVNTAALDLGLGSGGFDVVHVNLTRGLAGGETPEGVHVMKLNYTSLQHAVEPIDAPADARPLPERKVPVLVLPLHGYLAPACWAFAEATAGRTVGYVQTAGAALAGSMSRDVAALKERGLLAESVSAGPCFGGDREAISVVGALHAAALDLGWEAVIAGPGPGILGSASRYGHGGMAALEAAHAGLALGLPVFVAPRMSSGEQRERHLGLSHHSRSVLDLLLGGVRVPVPEDEQLAALWPDAAGPAAAALAEAAGEPHVAVSAPADLDGYAASGLPRRTMGRDLDEDRLFFAAALAAGRALGESV